MRRLLNSNGERHILNKTQIERDLGINISHNLKWAAHIQIVTNKAYSSLVLLKRTFKTWASKLSYIQLMSVHKLNIAQHYEIHI